MPPNDANTELSSEDRHVMQSLFETEAFKFYQKSVVDLYNQSLRTLKEGSTVEEVYRAQGAVLALERVYGLPAVITRQKTHLRKA